MGYVVDAAPADSPDAAPSYGRGRLYIRRWSLDHPQLWRIPTQTRSTLKLAQGHTAAGTNVVRIPTRITPTMRPACEPHRAWRCVMLWRARTDYDIHHHPAKLTAASNRRHANAEIMPSLRLSSLVGVGLFPPLAFTAASPDGAAHLPATCAMMLPDSPFAPLTRDSTDRSQHGCISLKSITAPSPQSSSSAPRSSPPQSSSPSGGRIPEGRAWRGSCG